MNPIIVHARIIEDDSVSFRGDLNDDQSGESDEDLEEHDELMSDCTGRKGQLQL